MLLETSDASRKKCSFFCPIVKERKTKTDIKVHNFFAQQSESATVLREEGFIKRS